MSDTSDALTPLIFGIPQCSTCVRYRPEVDFANTCDAFPERIPNEIIFNQFDHHNPYPGDHGLQYEEEIPFDEAMANLDDNQEPVFKAEDFEVLGEVIKVDPERQMVFGWFSIVAIEGRPVKDTQEDIITAETLEATAYDYVLFARKGGEMHDTSKEDQVVVVANLIESVVFTPEKQQAMVESLNKQGIKAEMDLKCTAWWGGFKVNDPETWRRIKAGELTAFSIGGRGRRDKIDL